MPSRITSRSSDKVAHILEHLAAQFGGLTLNACAADAVEGIFTKETEGKLAAMNA
jgi:hypothetical protein